jgi:molybdate transport system substrate-binding protein
MVRADRVVTKLACALAGRRAKLPPVRRHGSIALLGIAAGACTVLCAPGCKRRAPADAEPLRVAAAADLSDAFVEVGAAFERRGGRKASFTFGATGLLEKQIAQGAPYDLFAAANVSFIDDAVASGACDGATKAVYAEGHLALWSRSDAEAVVNGLADLAGADVVHVAIANPEHAPYGRAAKQALERSGVLGAIEKKIVYGENVQQALQFAQSGNAEVAIVALSLATSSGGHVALVDPKLHDPLAQAIVVCRGGAGAPKTDDARKLEAFVLSPDGRAILRRRGFSFPDERDSGAR